MWCVGGSVVPFRVGISTSNPYGMPPCLSYSPGQVCEIQVSDQRISSKHCRIYCEMVSSHLGGMEVG